MHKMSQSGSSMKRRMPVAERNAQPGIRKRPRYLTTWEESFRRMPRPQKGRMDACFLSQRPEDDTKNKNRFGLMDLFGGNRWMRPKETNSIGSKGSKYGTAGTPHRPGFRLPIHSGKSSKFFTLRLEHRQGGFLANHDGEERLLLFRSDQAGAIAKVIFSSSKPNFPENTHLDGRQITIAANATVHVLFVKDVYRGFNLGGLLFGLCTTYLREKYCNQNPSNFHTLPSDGVSSIRCCLDAEEDIRRHGKLVHFYEDLGLRKRKAKATFINNNDGETYRRIPMKVDLLVSPRAQEPSKYGDDYAAAIYSSFLPAILVSASGDCAKVENRSMDSWLIVEYQDGNIEFLTTDGRMLHLDEKGRCRLVDVQARMGIIGSGSFQLFRVSDMLDKVVYSREEEESYIQEKLLSQKPRSSNREKELWMIRSSVYGTFMGITGNRDIVFSNEASFWQADENFCLTHTSDSPARRQHHRRMWMKQSVAYVTLMRESYSAFTLHRMTIKEALNLTKYLPANPFSVTEQRTEDPLPSMRTLLFHTAELAREEGHPDWVQFVALVHGLAGALKCLEPDSPSLVPVPGERQDDDENDFDWTIYVDSRIVGCKASKSSTFAEFRHLNPDENDVKYDRRNGIYREQIGLENVLLSWTSSDYMYCMLKHNSIRLPKEAYSILKLFPLVDWHTRGEHASLSSESDEEVKDFVTDFYGMFQRSQDRILAAGVNSNEMSDKECHDLWTEHYSHIAEKYGAGNILKW